MHDGTRILTRRDVAELLSIEDCIQAVESAFLRHAEGDGLGSGVLSIPARDGGFHIKAAGLGKYFAAKVNGNFFHNAERFGMPRIQGSIVLADAENGYPLAFLDSIEITIRRTAAATAVAARHLARKDSSVLTIIGCGNQGRASLEAIRALFPIRRLFAFDSDPAHARDLGGEVVSDFRDAIFQSDICVTCTPSKQPILDDAPAGIFIAAVGADSHEKQEIAPGLMALSRVVVDDLEQCATIGDLHHALSAGVMKREDVAASLGEVISGKKQGRLTRDEIVIFDSTGTALQDVAAAALVYERSIAAGIGHVIRL